MKYHANFDTIFFRNFSNMNLLQDNLYECKMEIDTIFVYKIAIGKVYEYVIDIDNV